MILFLASIVDQLDFALEQIVKRDIHNARFGLMMTDNVVELIAHQFAKDKRGNIRQYSYVEDQPYEHQKQLDKALLESFSDKLRFAGLERHVSPDEERTINIMHEFRNELYHAGLAHEAILQHVAAFYFRIACDVVARYKPNFLGWSSTQIFPERARKYAPDWTCNRFPPFDHKAACQAMSETCGHDDRAMITALADHMDDVVSAQDTSIDVIAGGVYEGDQKTRDEAILETQAWAMAFSDEGKAFATANGVSGNRLDRVRYLSNNYPFTVKTDPIPSWHKRAQNVRRAFNPHIALSSYDSFMTSTARLRETLDETTDAAERAIESEVDRMRGK